MGVGLKGDIEQAKSLQPVFDWTLNEECYMYTECNDYGGGLRNFTAHGKAVWIAEYPSEYKAGAFHWAADSANAKANHWNLAQVPVGVAGTRLRDLRSRHLVSVGPGLAGRQGKRRGPRSPQSALAR